MNMEIKKVNDFCAFILTHGRPNTVKTYSSLRRQGYTGRIILVVDNQDPTQKEYVKKFPDEVYIFDKQRVIDYTDSADNFGPPYKSVIYARNVCFDIARELDIPYFIQLDDDYQDWHWRKDHKDQWGYNRVRNLDRIFQALLDFYKTTPVLTVALAQGGDYIGGTQPSTPPYKRKAMNSFVCGLERPFKFTGRINEDVNAYTLLGSRGNIFLTTMRACLLQTTTQKNAGGMTDLYLDQGTYVKSFYTVIHHPSSVSVGVLKDRKNPRLHHNVRWRTTTPMIISDRYKKYT